jgi:hypothetical protein
MAGGVAMGARLIATALLAILLFLSTRVAAPIAGQASVSPRAPAAFTDLLP